MSTKALHSTGVILNATLNTDLKTAERDVRVAAQKALAHSIVRSVKSTLRTIVEVVREASELQKKHSKSYDGGTI